MHQPARFLSAGWEVHEVDGHDREAVASAIASARRSEKPSLIACRTLIGKGAPNLQGSEKTHGAPLGDQEIAAARAALGWPHEPFVVPDSILAGWRAIAARGAAERERWEQRLAASAQRETFASALSRRCPKRGFDKTCRIPRGAFREGDKGGDA